MTLMQQIIHQSRLLQAHFDAVANRWDALQAPDRDAKLARLLVRFEKELSHATQILEVGSGTGQLIPLVAHTAPESTILAGDLAGKMLRQAQSKLTRPSITHLVQLDVHQLPLVDGYFDVVICHNALPHFVDQFAALQEIRRVLGKHGSLLILHDNNREAIHSMHRRIGEPVINDLLPDAAKMESLLWEAGYRDILVEDTSDHYLAAGYR